MSINRRISLRGFALLAVLCLSFNAFANQGQNRGSSQASSRVQQNIQNSVKTDCEMRSKANLFANTKPQRANARVASEAKTGSGVK